MYWVSVFVVVIVAFLLGSYLLPIDANQFSPLSMPTFPKPQTYLRSVR
jgi:hypothetical protein